MSSYILIKPAVHSEYYSGHVTTREYVFNIYFFSTVFSEHVILINFSRRKKRALKTVHATKSHTTPSSETIRKVSSPEPTTVRLREPAAGRPSRPGPETVRLGEPATRRHFARADFEIPGRNFSHPRDFESNARVAASRELAMSSSCNIFVGSDVGARVCPPQTNYCDKSEQLLFDPWTARMLAKRILRVRLFRRRLREGGWVAGGPKRDETTAGCRRGGRRVGKVMVV